MTPLRLSIGTDHAGFLFKEELKAWLQAQGHTVLDEGTHSQERCDYPDYAEAVAKSVVSGRAEKGILICGTGIGMSIAANKMHGIRAALVYDLYTARMSREHNNANILVLAARMIAPEYAQEICKVWFASQYEGQRHQARLDKIAKLEQTQERE